MPRIASLEEARIVHVGLEIFDEAVFVCRWEISTGMRKLHRAYCVVVCLENGLEIEGKAVP